MVKVTFLDYGAGNIRSLRNALLKVGCEISDVETPEVRAREATCAGWEVACIHHHEGAHTHRETEGDARAHTHTHTHTRAADASARPRAPAPAPAQDIANAQILIFPGVGSFGVCMENLHKKGFYAPLKAYLQSGKAFYGICLGMQSLFESSEETPGVAGIGIVPGTVGRFKDPKESVPHMGWNSLRILKDSPMCAGFTSIEDRFYFVHSFRASPTAANQDWVLTLTDYDADHNTFISSVQKGRIAASQFHPEKSGANGLRMLSNFLSMATVAELPAMPALTSAGRTVLAKRIIACLDVRENDAGDLVVTKGDQYDVREKDATAED